jgi:hypothetical protein
MAVYKIVIKNRFEHYDISQGMDFEKYTFRFKYNKRNDTWYITVFDINLNILSESIPCLTNVVQMTGRINADTFPIGDLIMFDVSGNGLDCTRDNFGTITQLFYSNII